VNHEEITTKIEIPPVVRPDTNIVHVDFTQPRPAQNDTKATPSNSTSAPKFSNIVKRRSTLFPKFRDLDLTHPWTVRLLAVGAIIVLSILML